jgi:hypothetical protein
MSESSEAGYHEVSDRAKNQETGVTRQRRLCTLDQSNELSLQKNHRRMAKFTLAGLPSYSINRTERVE